MYKIESYEDNMSHDKKCRKLAPTMIFFLPYLSASKPVGIANTSRPNSLQDAIKEISSAVALICSLTEKKYKAFEVHPIVLPIIKAFKNTENTSKLKF